MPGKPLKSDDEFFEESLSFVEIGKKLHLIHPDVVDEYNDHSLLKLIAINYWVGIFSPIAHRQLKEKYGYKVVYVDTMAGCGVTTTKRAGDFFCGSCPGAIIAANGKGFPFDKIIGVEINKEKANALKKRMKQLAPKATYKIYSKDIQDVSLEIAKKIHKKTISYIVIDPHGIQGMTWNGLEPLLKCKGDVMLTWFEDRLWRVRGAALSDGKSSNADAERLTELLGNEDWRDAISPKELTDRFIRRVLDATDKEAAQCVDIQDQEGMHYKMILFVGRCGKAQFLADQWKMNMEKRLGSSQGLNIAHLLDRKAGRVRDLREFGLGAEE
jgi:three-Cys-motif partner protein